MKNSREYSADKKSHGKQNAETRGAHRAGTKNVSALRTALCFALLPAVLFAAILAGCSASLKRGSLFKDTLERVAPDPDVHVRVTAAGEPGIVYAPPVDVAGYRYGPSIMYYADGTCDAWFSCNGYAGEWDWISMKHSTDSKTFRGEKVVLTPCADSYDRYSCCDPGVVYFGGYYYLAYTSTIVSGGINNNIFVARSKSPEGPFEKWNGSGWGGDPAPIIYYDESDLEYGAGAPSLIVVDGVLYVYYAWVCPEGNFLALSTSDTKEDWPARLVSRGEVYENHNGQDSSDVAYLEDAGKFVAFCTEERFKESSGIAVLESEDGLKFRQTGLLRTGLYKFAHNVGVARRPDGHIQLKDPVFVGYAFSDGTNNNWGKWATAFQRVKLELYRGEPEPVNPEERGILKEGYLLERDSDPPVIGIAPTNKTVELYKDDSSGTFAFVWLDPMLGAHDITNTNKLKFSGYDRSLISIRGNQIYPKGKAGETRVTVRYGRFQNELKVYVYDDYSAFHGSIPRSIKEFTPVIDEYTLSLSDRHRLQIRGLVRFSDTTWGEAFNDEEMVPARRYPVTYEVSDPTVISVSERGIIQPLSAGTATVKVTVSGTLSFNVKVTVCP